MSSFVARTAPQIYRDLVSKVVTNLGGLNIDEGGPETAILGAVSEEMALHEARLEALVNAHGLDATGPDLDDVVAQIMSGLAVARGPATRASAAAMRATRATSTGALTIPAGSVFYRLDDKSIRYATTEEVEIADGALTYPGAGQTPIRVRCLTVGKAGNARPGLVRGIESAPSGIIEVTNVEPIGGGSDVERDGSLQQRARLLLASIAKAQPAALRYLAGRWVAADGTAIRHAATFEDPGTPGYTELLLDDGEGFIGATRAAAETTGTVPPTGAPYLWFDGPAATEPLVSIDGGPYQLASAIPGAVVIHERGRVEFLEGYGPAAGATWSIVGHLVYVGAIAEVQRVIEGDTFAAAALDYGWRAAGTRVRARPPLVSEIAVEVRCEYAFSNVVQTIEDGNNLVTDAIVEFFRSTPPGEPFRRFALAVEVGRIREVTNFEVVSPPADVRPLTPRHRVSTAANLVTFE